MAITLVVNPGSSSKKFALAIDGQIKHTYQFEKIGEAVELCTVKNGSQQICEGVSREDYHSALEYIIADLQATKIITLPTDITAVGIRVVAPGTLFQKHTLIDLEYIGKLQSRLQAAPLHIPPILEEIKTIRLFLSQTPLWAVSDSAFHASMIPEARTYSIKTVDTTTHDLYRFGYHGISYASIMRHVPKLVDPVPKRVVVSHVGSGVSMTAMLDGKSIDTSMGFGPGSGLVMGSRAGDLDSGALLELMRVTGLSREGIYDYLQKEGGLRGLAGEADFRYLLERQARDDETARFALSHFRYHWQKQLGALIAILGGLDLLVLTATAAERSSQLRSLLLSGLDHFGIVLDHEKNDSLNHYDGYIHQHDGLVQIAVMRTHELDEMVLIVDSLINNNL